MKKILYGICGIGNGHTYRQLPIITTFAERGDQVMIFAYGSSYAFYHQFAKDYPNLAVERVAVPFYQGCASGLDFSASLKMVQNQENFFAINTQAWAKASQWLGQPNLVISDYEPTSAQYAYAYHAPLITFDQQSKYLMGDFPETLSGQSYRDEVMRLRLFFPKAAKRIACSFFHVAPRQDPKAESVVICPPPLRDQILQIQRAPQQGSHTIIVYFSEQHFAHHSLPEMVDLFSEFSTTRFHIFLPQVQKDLPLNNHQAMFYHHGDSQFNELLANCHGIIATAGHTLLAEAMYLGIPVYTLPLPIYEQLINADVIDRHGFGLSHGEISKEKLAYFLAHLPTFAQNIHKDRTTLLRTTDLPSLMGHFVGI